MSESESDHKTGPTAVMVPDGDNRPRHVCLDCGFIHYRNPLVVVGSVCAWNDKLLLCRRAIEPRKGFWTIPAGYLELEEATHTGAAREAAEEANADIAIERLLAVYNIPRISQVQVIYAARLTSADVSAGEESLEVALLDWHEIPWSDIAFPSVQWALNHHRDAVESGDWSPRSNPPGESGDY